MADDKKPTTSAPASPPATPVPPRSYQANTRILSSVDRVPTSQAVRDLVGTPPLPISGTMEDGVKIITYSFDRPAPVHDYKLEATDVQPLNEKEQSTVRGVLADIMKVANIRFRPAADGQYPDIAYFKGKIIDKETGAYQKTGWRRDPSEEFNILFVEEIVMGESQSLHVKSITHETLHALGLQHPGEAKKATPEQSREAGLNPLYTADSTAMSYNPPKNYGLGVYDVAALQYLYGKPKESALPKTINAAALPSAHFIFAQKPVTLDLRDAEYTGHLVIDADKEITGHYTPNGSIPEPVLQAIVMQEAPIAEKMLVDGSLAKHYGKIEDTAPVFLKIRLTEGTQIKDVLNSPDAKVALNITGNELPNRLQGGGQNDYLVPRGGGDVMAGGNGADVFDIGRKSGFDNVIADFNAGGSKDAVQLNPPIVTAALKEYKDYPAGGKRQSGTLVTGKDGNGVPVASVFVANASRADVAAAIRHGGDKPHKIEIVMTDEEQSPAPAAPAPTPLSKNSRTHGAGK